MLASYALLPGVAIGQAQLADHAYFSIAYLTPTTKFGGAYQSHHDDGTDNIKFRDQDDPRKETAFPVFALGLRLAGRFWLGADYLSMRGHSDGIIGKKVRFGPFRFFVTAPTKEDYEFNIARLWLGYRLLERPDQKLLISFGLSTIQAKATARIEEIGEESAQGILPLPSIGLNWSWSGPYETRWSLTGDYSHLEVNHLVGRISTLGVSVEKPLSHGFSIGLGYKKYDIRANATRPHYRAEIEQNIAGTQFFIQQNF